MLLSYFEVSSSSKHDINSRDYANSATHFDPSWMQSKRASSGASKPVALGTIALGTDKGSVSVWDLKRGALAHSLGEVCVFPRDTKNRLYEFVVFSCA